MAIKLTLKMGAIAALGLVAACGEQTEQSQSKSSQYQAEIKRTSYGIPHITANDYGSLGYGEGYVAAEDHVCNIAYAIVQVRGELSQYYGAGKANKNLMSDAVIRGLDIPGQARAIFEAQPKENQEWVTGYTAGYNRYIEEVGRDNITSWCQGAAWVKTVSPEDILSRGITLARTVPRMAGMVAGAQPPAAEGQKTSEIDVTPELFAEAAEATQLRGMGSNGWAIGKDMTENGRGMLLANPHYPWIGPDRFWEKHLVIPGKLNIYGSHLVGVPGVAIGFNDNVGWTHTVSNSQRVVLYKLDLVPGDPTSYLYDGEPRKMTSRTVSIPIKGENGDLASKEHTVWFSHYGPIVTMPGLPWNEKIAFTVRDANAENHNVLSQWKAMGQATDMDAFKEAHRKWNAMPWVNTMATSNDGRAVYLDGSNVGNLSEEAIALWRERVQSDKLTKALYERNRLTLLDGSDSRFEWQSHPEAVIDGVVPFINKPQQDRPDYIFNANDSYWLTNVAEPLTGYSPLYGREASARSLRTRMNAVLLSENGPDSFAGANGKFSMQEMQQAIFSNRSLAAELLQDELVAACQTSEAVTVGEQQVDLSEACAVLAAYNGKLDLDSKGAVLFREWITSYSFRDTKSSGALFAVAFDPSDPVHTPRGLADKAQALEKLAQAVLTLNEAGLALDSALADAQFAYRGEEKIAVHGGGSWEGVANLIDARRSDSLAFQVDAKQIAKSRDLTDKGYPVTGGSSYVMSLSYTDTGPVAEAFLTYSQSGDPTSEHFTDQTKLFAEKKWRPVLFKVEDIDADVKSSLVLTGPR